MQLTRRHFLAKTTAVAAATTIVPRHVLGGPKFVPPSEKVNVAMVGVGGQGRWNLHQLFKQPDAQIVAVADPIEHHDLAAFYYKGVAGRKPIKAAIEKHHSKTAPNYRCAEYEDFRVMLDKEKAIDAILCATPDHLHAYVSATAMRRGKHVYCEKPLTHNIWEARQVSKIAKETGVATQLGNQGHAKDGIRQTVEWIADGAIGPVRDVHVWVGSSRWNDGLKGRPTETPPVPKGINWDLWIGPREMRPYHPTYTPVTWRDYWDFGGGTLGDFGCHDLDAAFWALDLAAPTTVEARPAGHTDAEVQPYGEICYYRFGPRGDKPPVQLTWYGGGLKPPRPDGLRQGETLPRSRSPPRRRQGFHALRRRRRCAATSAGGKDEGLQAARGQTKAFQRPSPRLARRLQGRSRGKQQLRLRRQADRTGPPRRPLSANRQTARMGCRPNEGDERPRSRRIHQGGVSEGVGDSELTWPVRFPLERSSLLPLFNQGYIHAWLT